MATQRTPIYKGQVIELGIESVDLPDSASCELEVVRHPESAALVAVNANNQVCLLRQYRPAVRNWVWEIPMERLTAYEIPILTAQRKLEEVSGLRGNIWTSLGPIFSTPGFCDEIIHLFLVHELSDTGHAPDAQDQPETHWINFHEALTWAYMGKICDAKTVAGLFHAQAYIDRGH